ncbi:MAG TPA: DUF167 domain-containing protein [Verrucomicrobiae bacterium]|jgi:uncharacterized protein|nr:DUF167 domain-containing protein [Verrucomicrobiae bacterium]
MARRIRVTVQPQARKREITEIADGEFRAAITAPARDGKANLALIELLAEYFKLPKSSIRILRGRSSRRKLVEVDG